MNQLDQSPLKEAMPIVSGEDWSELRFNRKKAFASALFAKAAYWHLADFELSQNSRVNVVPCIDYEMIATQSVSQADAKGKLIEELGIEQPEVIIRPHIIILIFKLNKVVFISIRGTRDLFVDWRINLNLRLVRPLLLNKEIAFHRGFFRAVASASLELYDKIKDIKDPICITGHSLGGALAAILYTIYHLPYTECLIPKLYGDDYEILHLLRSKSAAYSFGMPRYGNSSANLIFNSIYHIYNPNDIVPRIPPLLFGYDDPLYDYSIDRSSDHQVIRGRSFDFIGWIMSLVRFRRNMSHSIEAYCDKLRIT